MQFLLERLAQPAPASPDQVVPFDLRAAIAAQIQRIVAARVVEAADGELSLLEFGMPNVVELGAFSKNDLEVYGARLARLIARYEPRLQGACVRLESTGLPLAPYRLAVAGVLAGADAPPPVGVDLPAY
jgi:predicted component of type VI protein secretion system